MRTLQDEKQRLKDVKHCKSIIMFCFVVMIVLALLSACF